MDFSSGLRRKHLKVVSSNLQDLYKHDLQLYIKPPNYEITLTEFEDLALDRLQVLRILEQATHKGHKLYSNEWRDCVKADIKKENLNKFYKLIRSAGNSNPTDSDLQARRADHISHFILRLVYCRSDDLRRWFLAREIEFFSLRFFELSNESIKEFLTSNNLTYTPISPEEKDSIREQLLESTAGFYDGYIENHNFYKVLFTEVCGLVKNRRVFLNGGFAYIPSPELIQCVVTIFRAHLNEALAYASKRLPALDDDRLNNLIETLHHTYTGNSYATQNDKNSINIANLDRYSRTHFPLCMRHIHEMLRANHHLKHFCRMQYGLFIKGIGVTFEDAMTFWREEFTKKMDGNQFEKQHAYNIKHQYGKVGRMLNYSPYSCMKIISTSVGPGEHHGCPFRHWDATLLKQKLNEHGISSNGTQEILDITTKGHFQIACSKYFECKHGQPSKTIVNHPNQYFEESFELNKNDFDSTSKQPKKAKTEEELKTTE